MNTPNYPPRGGPQYPQGGPYGPPPGYGPPPPGRPPGTPPGGQQYGPPPGRPPQTPPGGRPYGAPGPYGPGPGGPGPGGPGPGGPYGGPPPNTPPGGQPYDRLPPPNAPAAPAIPPPPVPKKSNAKVIRIVVAVVVALVVAGVGYVFFNRETTPSQQAGDCIKVNDVKNADIATVDCKSADAMYKVGVAKDDPNAKCPNDNYLGYSVTGGSKDVKLCLVLMAKEGQCFKLDGQVTIRTDCTKDAVFKVAKVIDGSDDPKGCGKNNEVAPLTYPEPKLTLCRAAPDAAPAG